jgi:hypothetical protein
MPKIRITNLVPMPFDIRAGRKSKYRHELLKMYIGDCVTWPERARANCYRMARSAGIRVKTTKEKAPRNKVHVFRVS